MNKIYAAVDIGSNAIRMLINNIEKYPLNPDFKKVAFLRVPIRLGEDVFTIGKISKDKENKLINAMQGFSHLFNAYDVDIFKAFATSAMRDAKNGDVIVNSIYDKTGINIEIIDGKKEADIIYKAAGNFNSLLNNKHNYLYVDVGGGSTEIVLYGKQNNLLSHSFQLGTVRILVNAAKDNEWDNMKNWLDGINKKYAPKGIIASGGNINKIHKLLGKNPKEYITLAELKSLYTKLTKLSYEERIIKFKLNEYRADVIIPALKIFITIAKTCKINEIYVPKVGLVDGMIHQLYLDTN